MKTLNKITLGLMLISLSCFNIKSQPKSEITNDNETSINWAEADTLYTFRLNEQTKGWEYFQREIRKFENNLPIENFVQIRTNNQWQNYLRANYSYNNKGDEISEIIQEWDTINNNWVNAKQKTSTYKRGKREEILFQEWKYPTNKWFNIMKYLINYNNSGNENTIIISLFNGVTNQWDNYKKFQMFFDAENIPPSKVITESWANQNWRTDGKYIMEYNWHGDKTLEIRHTWNYSKKDWIKAIMHNMKYDKKGNQTEFIEQKYDNKTNNWIYFNKISALYNQKGYMTEKTEYKWNRTTKNWDIKGQFKFTSDSKI
ncbi:MAG: hypothetical protein MI739_11885 [Bacteroidales bacterium]|nr:hypothetical protein [Bacteroidales bacterium]